MKAVGVIRACPHCDTEVQIILTKKQLKAMLKGLKESSPAKAEMLVENILGRDEIGDLNG